MRGKLMVFILIIGTLMLSACSSASDDNETIQLWWYDYQNSDLYTKSSTGIIEAVQNYCSKKEIPLEVIQHNKNTLAYDDFVLKRNVAMAKGNVLIIEDASMLHDIAKQHADYSKIKNYGNLLDVYKNRYCIPLFVGHSSISFNNDILSYYDISVDKSLITKGEYLELKQSMKEKGARFAPNIYEYAETIEFYLVQNNLSSLYDYEKIISNENEFKTALKKTVTDVYNDINTYGKGCAEFDFTNSEQIFNSSYVIYDENSKLEFNFSKDPYLLTDYEGYNFLNEDNLNMTFILSNSRESSPSIYIYKKVTNEKIYDIVNEILDETSYESILNSLAHPYSPVLNTNGVREALSVDEDWNYNGIIENPKIVGLINETYEMIVADNYSSMDIADSYFKNPMYHAMIYNEINSLVQTLITENIDYNTKKAEDIMNESIDDFITNFKVYYD